MTDGSEEVLRRHFVAIATASYDDPAWPPLPGVRAEVEVLRTWLCDEGLGGRRFDFKWSELAEDPHEGQVHDRLRNLARERTWTDADAAVLFITGHGMESDDTHYIVLRDSDTTMLSSTALRTADLIAWIADTPIEHLLLILDACFAGRVAGDVLRLSKRVGRRWVVLPSATRDEEAVTGALTRAIAQFLDDLRKPEGRRYGEGPYIDVADFIQDVQKLIGAGQSLIPLYGSQISGPHVCLPNPHHRQVTAELAVARRELALPREDLETHWGPRARGVATDDQPGWLFSGRRTLMRRLITAATGQPGATIVCGGAGCGKSAALARLVTLSDSQFVERYADRVDDIPATLRPPIGIVDVAVLATGKLSSQVLAQICRSLAVPIGALGSTELPIDQQLAAWHTWLRSRDRPITIVVDALDEAADPRELVREVLVYLEPDPSSPQVRLIVGIRSYAAAAEGYERLAYSDVAALADQAEVALGANRVSVDEAPWWDDHDIVAYVRSILYNTPGSPYRDVEPHAIERVAAAIGWRAGRSFLVARIAATSLAVRDRIVSFDDNSWLEVLDDGLLGVFRDDLQFSVKDPQSRRRAVILMRAVAFAHGSGLPWRGIWPLIAQAVDEDDGSYGDADIAWLLNTRLAAYLVTDRNEGATVYRLFHDSLRATLRDKWRDLLSAPCWPTAR